MWRIDPRAPQKEWQEVTPRGFKQWNISFRHSSGKGPWYISSNDRDPAAHDLYSVNTDGLEKTLIAQNNGGTLYWLWNKDGDPIARVQKKEIGNYETQVPENPENGFGKDANWRALISYTSSDDLYLRHSNAGNSLTASSRIDRDKYALINVDTKTSEQAILSQNDEADLNRTYRFTNDGLTDIAEYAGGYLEYEALTPLGKQVIDLLKIKDDPTQINVLSRTGDGAMITFALSRAERAWEYWLINTKENSAEFLGRNNFAKHADYLAKTKPVRFTARDGMSIPALLTLPHGAEAKNLPLILLVHGGPAGKDVWQYSQEKQFFANRGYATLSVNFRGSTGYGKAFQKAGFRQFGRAMQDDLVDATKWAISQGIADPKAIAIYGGSYGGYASMMGVARDPDLFTAGISFVGATDIEYQTLHAPHFWGMSLENWTRYFGSKDIPSDVEEMRKYSPINLVQNINVPVFLAHGVQDHVVDRAQSEAFEHKLEELGKDYESLYLENEGHGLRRWQSRIVYFSHLEEFLHKHLGGRTGGFDKAQLGAKWMN